MKGTTLSSTATVDSQIREGRTEQHGTSSKSNLRMSKCHVQELGAFYTSLMKDVVSAYPTLVAELRLDLDRLQRAVKSRGIRVYLEDLPAACKHLDKCLDDGKYKLSGLPLTKRYSNRVVIPKLFRGLYLLVFDEPGNLKADCDVQAVFFLRELLLAGKKATITCSDDKVLLEVEKFVEVDNLLPDLERFWQQEDAATCEQSRKEDFGGFQSSKIYSARVDALPPGDRRRMSACLGMLDKISGILTATLGSYDPGVWRFRHGPGAVSETTGPSNKYWWKGWSDSLELEFPWADYGFHSYSAWADRSRRSDCGSHDDADSRMVAVPKTYSKPRLIAAEPSQHQWCQQNLRHYFAVRCSKSWLNKFVRFDDQTVNQKLCKIGSSTGALATVDLSSASDRVSCHFVGQLFRGNPKLLRSLKASRTHRCQLLGQPQGKTPCAGRSLTLKKFSTMGNACTFPVESLGFLAIALASVLTTRGLRCNLRTIRNLVGEVSVYGDDLVVPVDCRKQLVETLEILDFKVNDDKTFWGANFRESCGVDSFRGVDVTPVYWKTFYDGGPESLESVIGTVNNLYKRWLMNASMQLSWTLPCSQLAMVDMRSGVTGLQSRSGIDNSCLRRRWNRNLQRYEVMARVIRGTQHRTPTDNDSALLQYFTEAPEPTTSWSHGILQRPELKNRLGWVSVDSLGPQSSGDTRS